MVVADNADNVFRKMPALRNARTDFSMIYTGNNVFHQNRGNMPLFAEFLHFFDGLRMYRFKNNLSHIVQESANVGIRDDCFLFSAKVQSKIVRIQSDFMCVRPQLVRLDRYGGK